MKPASTLKEHYRNYPVKDHQSFVRDFWMLPDNDFEDRVSKTWSPFRSDVHDVISKYKWELVSECAVLGAGIAGFNGWFYFMVTRHVQLDNPPLFWFATSALNIPFMILVKQMAEGGALALPAAAKDFFQAKRNPVDSDLHELAGLVVLLEKNTASTVKEEV